MTGLDELEALAQRIEQAPTRIAARAAPDLLRVAQAQWAEGRAPDGSSWPPTKDGRIALTSLTSQATAHAEGPAIVLELPDELAYHQNPTQPGHPKRATLPEEGAELPPAWAEAIEDAAREELGS